MCDFDDNYFIESIKKVGVNFKKTNDGFQTIFDKDATVLRNDLEKKINSTDSVFKLETFLEDFKELCTDESFLRCILSTSLLKDSEDDDLFESLDVNQISLCRFLLLLEEFQPQLIDFLLDTSIPYLMDSDAQAIEWWTIFSQNLSCLPFVFQSDNLTKKLLDILNLVPLPIQLEILSSLRGIIPVNSYSLVIKFLKNFFCSNYRLNVAIIDCLNSLKLNDNEKNQLIDTLFRIIDLENFQKFFEFLLSLRNEQWTKNELKPIVIRCRNLLNNLILLKSDQSEHFLIALKTLVNDFRLLEIWPMIINSEFNNKHEPIDLMILIMVYHYTNNQTRKLILKIFRSKIQNHQFTFDHLNQIFEHFIVLEILKELSDTILDLSMTILTIAKTDSSYMIQFSMEIVRKFFQSKYTNEVIKNDCIRQLIDCFSLIDRGSMIHILETIQNIVDVNLNNLQSQVSIFTPLLNKQNFMEVRELRITFQILGALIFGPNHNEIDPLRTDILISMRKHLSCCNQNLKNRGIVAATTITKFMAYNPEAQNQIIDFSTSEEFTTSHINSKFAKEAVQMLETINYHTEANNEAKSLFYDELGETIQLEWKKHHSDSFGALDKEFLKWLLDYTDIIFQTEFLRIDNFTEINGLKLTEQFRIHMIDHEIDRVVINISKIFFTKPNQSINSDSIVYLSSIFRLYRLLRIITSNGKLNEIEALLSCAIFLPEVIENECFLDNEWSKFSDNGNIKSQILNSIFFSINWFREVISAFIDETGAGFSAVILKRIEHIIYLEKIFFKYVKLVDNYKLPYSYFPIYQELKTIHNSQSKKTSGTKKRKVDINNPVLTIEKTTLTQTQNPFGSSSKKQISLISKIFDKSYIEFRQIGLSIVNYLQLPLVEQNRNLTLKLKVFNFLLNDAVYKLTMLLDNNKKYIYSMDTTIEEFLKKCLKFVTNLIEDFQIVIFRIKTILQHCSYQYENNEMYTEKVTESKDAVQLILQFFSLIFSWNGFLERNNYSLLKEFLKKICSANNPNQQLSQMVSLKTLLMKCAKYFHQYSNEFCTLLSVKYFMLLLNNFYKIENDSELKILLSDCAQEFLQRKWYTDDGSIDYDTLIITNLLKYYLNSLKLDTLSDIVIECKNDIETYENDYLNNFPCIQKKNFPIVYMELFNSFCDYIQQCFNQKSTSEKLYIWNDIIKVWVQLMKIIKIQNTRRNFLIFMKKSQIILKYFLKYAIPVFNDMMKLKADVVIEILNASQPVTRFLHKLCCYSKKKKDVGLYSNIPQVRLSLETIVYKVKAMLISHKQHDVFWMGNLRNRDIYDEELNEISTRSSDEDSSENSIDDDQDIDKLSEIASDTESEIL